MYQDKNKHDNPNKITVEVNVAKIVKYLCITSVLIVSLVLGSKVVTEVFTHKSDDLM
ncbi:MAG: hypothetical protein GX323_04725 [Clostridiales bacterium]|nr:hypothetical protein [Clostridiales bacterium]